MSGEQPESDEDDDFMEDLFVAIENGRDCHIQRCSAERRQAAQMLLRLGAWPDLRDRFSETPLHLASQFGRHHIMRLLLDAGASMTLTDRDGETCLHRAARSGNAGAVCLLLLRGACLESLNRDGKYPRNLAASQDISSVFSGDAIGKQLMATYKEEEEQWSIAQQRSQAIRERDEHLNRIIEVELQHEAERITRENYVKKTMKKTQTRHETEAGVSAGMLTADELECPLFIAATMGDADMVLDMLDDGADVDITDARGRTPVSAAVAGGAVNAIAVVKILLECEPNVVSRVYSRRRTLLHTLACSGGNGVWASREVSKRAYNTCKSNTKVDIKLQLQQLLSQLHPSLWSHDVVELRLIAMAKYLINVLGIPPTARDDDGIMAHALAFNSGHYKLGDYLTGASFLRHLDDTATVLENADDDSDTEIAPFVGMSKSGRVVTLTWSGAITSTVVPCTDLQSVSQ